MNKYRERLLKLKKENPVKFLEVLPHYIAGEWFENIKKEASGLDKTIFDVVTLIENKVVEKIMDSPARWDRALIGLATYLAGSYITRRRCKNG